MKIGKTALTMHCVQLALHLKKVWLLAVAQPTSVPSMH